MADMPTTYETHTTTTTATSSSGIAFNKAYITSIPGILRIVEIVLSLITLICAAVGWWSEGSGWIQFVAAWSMITILVWFILYLLSLNVRIPGPALLIELIYFVVLAVLYLIAGIVAAVYAAKSGYYFWGPAIGAAAFFSFACMVVLAVDVFFLFRAFRGGASGTTTMSSSSHTTTTTSTVVEKETY